MLGQLGTRIIERGRDLYANPTDTRANVHGARLIRRITVPIFGINVEAWLLVYFYRFVDRLDGTVRTAVTADIVFSLGRRSCFFQMLPVIMLAF
ncbi:MAG: hypothetical protein LBI39_00785 [Puniceicoccales bacterium]|nr:hypothetical protein [Puniceicoccales bacterium]